MSECIVRMEMPGSCYVCRFRMSCLLYRRWIDGEPDVLMPQPLDDGCRIIAVLPEKHGRLVDKDEMLKKIENYHRYMTIGRESDPRCIIEDSPTIVPADTAERR